MIIVFEINSILVKQIHVLLYQQMMKSTVDKHTWKLWNVYQLINIHKCQINKVYITH